MSESEQTKRLYRKAFPSKPDVYVEPYWGEQLELSRRLDALEAAKGKATGVHDVDEFYRDFDDKVSEAFSKNPLAPRVGPPQPSNDLKDLVGERIVQEFATRIESDHDAIIAAINAAVAEVRARAEKAEAEVKRLRDPVWLLSLWCPSPSQLREHFARHAEPRP